MRTQSIASRRQTQRVLPLLAAYFVVCLAIGARAAWGDEASERFFETRIRPLLVQHCSECHGADQQENGLRVDSRNALLKGGDRGPAIVPGDAAASRLIQAVRQAGELKMPPEKKLNDGEIRALSEWVKLGAPWPASSAPFPAANYAKARQHWAFQPVREVDVPNVKNAQWIRSPIDAFVVAKLKAAELAPSGEADRRTLIRRASYTLTGLPPSSDEVTKFVNDDAPKAYEHLIDRLLASQHYGEQWARHWLDVARYSDTKGYVYAREERFWVHAWAYRDWVVSALNDDMPYDRFLLLQLAADQVEDRNEGDLAAMGFLTLGRRFLGVKHDIIDDRIDVVTRGTMGLTVGCARCHDHKYDPIPTADYYSLYGVFDNCAEQIVDLDDASARGDAFAKELGKRQQAFQARLAAERAASALRVRARIADYLRAQTELEKYPAEGFDQIFQPNDLLPAFVRRWESFLRQAKRSGDPVFAAWHGYAEISPQGFAENSVKVTQQLQAAAKEGKPPVNPMIAQAFVTPPRSFAEVIERYAKVFTDVDARWKGLLAEAAKAGTAVPTQLPDPAAEQIRQVLYGPTAPCEIPDESMVHIESYFPTATCEALWKLQGEIDRWINSAASPPRFALTLVDRPQASEPRIFRRGNPLEKGDEVPRRFLSLLSSGPIKTFEHGSGRRELAEAIIDPANPLTARVIVNRVWAHHFGRGLVPTPSDFGTRAGEPSHGELLDWLAARFVAEGWSLKKLHRSILLSSTFRQSSAGPADRQLAARAQSIDPANRWLWRMNERRLSFEEFRDSLLAASGELDRQLGGKPANLFNPPYPKRRTLYGLVDRQFLPGTLRIFDFANPDLHIPQRTETTVPQQALFAMNHPFVLQRAQALAAAAKRQTPEATIAELFQRTCQRPPSEAETADALAFVQQTGETTAGTRATAGDWQYGFGAYDEDAKRLNEFTRLPHFTGTAWQGGPNWPDAKLGWVQLTADGGHPGNDRGHGCVRRWTAPRKMSIRIESKLVHDAAPGDGIRAFVVSARAGQLHAVKIHQKTVDLNVASLDVEQGETIDFVVDIGDVLHSDQYVWKATIQELTKDDSAVTWNSQEDFPANNISRLTRWEQLAQVLLCMNEFLFVD